MIYNGPCRDLQAIYKDLQGFTMVPAGIYNDLQAIYNGPCRDLQGFTMAPAGIYNDLQWSLQVFTMIYKGPCR